MGPCSKERLRFESSRARSADGRWLRSGVGSFLTQRDPATHRSHRRGPRAVSRRGGPRSRWHGGRVPRDRRAARSQGRAEGAAAGARRRRDVPCPLPAGVARGGRDRPPQRHPGLRGGRGRRPALHRDALRRRRRPRAAARGRGAARARARARAGGTARRRAGRRPRARARPSRRQAVQCPRGEGRPRLPVRLRPDQGRRGRPAHRDRARSPGPRCTWRPRRCARASPTRARTSTRSAASCSSASPASRRSRARRRRR